MTQISLFPLPVARTKAICVEPTLGEPPVSLLIISSAKSWAYLRTCVCPSAMPVRIRSCALAERQLKTMNATKNNGPKHLTDFNKFPPLVTEKSSPFEQRERLIASSRDRSQT